MLTQEQVLEAVRDGRESETIDGRDYGRLVEFFPVGEWETLGFARDDKAPPHAPKPWTREAVIEQLREDVAFGFEKALGKRGISAGAMYGVVCMWLWVLEEPVPSESDYAQYGLPVLKATALRFGFPNPIGDDTGREYKYSMRG